MPLTLKNAGGYTDADTFDRFSIHLRDSAQLVRQFTIPHPSLAARGAKNFMDRVHQEGPAEYKSVGLNVGAHILWAMAALPGKSRCRMPVRTATKRHWQAPKAPSLATWRMSGLAPSQETRPAACVA